MPWDHDPEKGNIKRMIQAEDEAALYDASVGARGHIIAAGEGAGSPPQRGSASFKG